MYKFNSKSQIDLIENLIALQYPCEIIVDIGVSGRIFDGETSKHYKNVLIKEIYYKKIESDYYLIHEIITNVVQMTGSTLIEIKAPEFDRLMKTSLGKLLTL